MLSLPTILFMLATRTRTESDDEPWGWTILKFVWIGLCFGLGFAMGYAGSFSFAPSGSDPANTGIMIGISLGALSLALVFVFAPFYRQWARFEKDAGPLGIFLLSLIVPILYTVFFFLTFTYLTPLVDFEHPAYSWVSVRPVIMFAAFFGTSGVLFVVS